jgi:hypothetical protein
MALKRTTLRLYAKDLKVLERLAKDEAKRTGSRANASSIGRLIREFLHTQKKGR